VLSFELKFGGLVQIFVNVMGKSKEVQKLSGPDLKKIRNDAKVALALLGPC
jgi:hypothetical protein